MAATTTIGIDLIGYTLPAGNEPDTGYLRGRYVAQGFVEFSAHILDVALGVLGLIAAAFTLFQTPEINKWAFDHFLRIQYLLCRPFFNFLTARIHQPEFEEPVAVKNDVKDELKLLASAPKYTLAIIEPATNIIKTAVESDYFFGKHVLSRVVGFTAGVTALVVLIGEKVLGLIAAIFALAIGDNKLLNYHAYDLLRIHEGFLFVPYFLYFGILSPAICVHEPEPPPNAKKA